ncbi:MAG: hypothetical protein JW963_18955 [Anaerolineales bacterium]|nr:hypothetical protein [Anaerolineales bacterium]
MISDRKATPVERFFTRSPFSIVTMVARIKGKVTEKMLRNAVEKAQQRHFLLRVRIKDNQDHTQWFTPDDVQEIPIEVVERKSQDDWIEVHAAAMKRPFEFETRPAIRFILVQSPDISELIILCHHMICDGMSLAYLARDLLVYLGDPAQEVDVLPAPPTINLDNLPTDVSQSGLAKFFINRMNQKWAEQSEYFDQKDYRVLTQAYWDHYTHAVLSVELSEGETSALVDRCRAEQVTVNSALSAAFCGAQSFVEGERPYHKKIVVAASLRDRLPKSPGEGIGMYAGGVELAFKYNHQRGFWENARAFHRAISPKYTNKRLFGDVLNWLYLDPTMFEAMNFKKLGELVPMDSSRYKKLAAFSKQADVVSSILERDQLLSLESKHWGTATTNLGRLDFPKHYGKLELGRLIMQPGGGIPLANANLVLGAVTCAGKLSLVLEYAAEAVEPGVMQQVRAKAMAYLA